MIRKTPELFGSTDFSEAFSEIDLEEYEYWINISMQKIRVIHKNCNTDGMNKYLPKVSTVKESLEKIIAHHKEHHEE